MVKVLFVCLGNICRSPMAEAVFHKMVFEAGLSEHITVDSAGTGTWHMGETAHQRTLAVLQKHGIAHNGRSRQITAYDMKDPNTYIIVMDQSNRVTVEQRHGTHPRLSRLLEFASNTHEENVPDPYYANNFDYVYELVLEACQGLLAHIRQQEGL